MFVACFRACAPTWSVPYASGDLTCALAGSGGDAALGRQRRATVGHAGDALGPPLPVRRPAGAAAGQVYRTDPPEEGQQVRHWSAFADHCLS